MNIVMTLHPLHAGDGYAYLTREVASADVRRTRGEELGDYYTAEGNPPGIWAGRGQSELGVSGTVSEKQMRAFFGEGLHPDADAIIERLIDEGMSPEKAQQQARLGRKPMAYEPVETYRERLDARYEAHERMHGQAPGEHERAKYRRAVGAAMFAEQHGRRPRDAVELVKYIAQVAKPKPQAVSGFDLVFTPPKSVSVLWGLGDDQTRRVIESAHEKAWRSVLADAEDHIIKTRAGRAGVAQLDVPGGVAAAAFRHYDSRTGDPNLHTHVVVPNRVKSVDGKWRTLDGRTLYAAAVSMSEKYNRRVVHDVAAQLDGAVAATTTARGRRPVYEIDGVNTTLIAGFSGRTPSISAATAELIDRYVREHGHEPSEEARYKLVQQATIDTRPAKKGVRSLATMRDQWRQQAVDLVGRRPVDNLLREVRRAARRQRQANGDAAGITPELVDRLAQQAVTQIEEQRATWTRYHVEAEVQRQLSGAGLGNHDDLVERVTGAALTGKSIRLTAPSTEPMMPELRRADGESIFVHAQTVRYSSDHILNAERRVVEAARTTAIAPVSGELFDRVLAQHEATPGNRKLDSGQIAVARVFACDGRLLVAGIGPAGAGKTTTMKVVARAVEAAGGRVVGLAPSARAASVLSDELSVPAHTLHRWLWHRTNGTNREAWTLRPGDLLLVDEAGMAGTLRLDGVIREAIQAGAVVRLLGDPQQLGAVESGGMLRLVQREAGAVELNMIHRFADPEEAAASLRLRDGTEDAWRWYWSKNRISHGDRETMLDAVYRAWLTETRNGELSLMIAPTNDDTRQLNDRARADRIAAGEVEAVGVTLHDGTRAGHGDLIVTRRNESRLRLFSGRDMVLNGDIWTVTKRHSKGDLTVQHVHHGGTIRLPRTYVAADVELAYATTIHRAQGMTVDRVNALIDGAVSRAQAYVALTRARLSNRLYGLTEPGSSVHEMLDAVRRNFGAAVSATEHMRDSLAEVESIVNLSNKYLYIADQHAEGRHRSAVAATRGVPVKDILESPAWPRVSAAIGRAERAGWSARDILDLAGTRGLAKADEPAAALAYRIRTAQEAADRQRRRHGERPLAGVTDDALTRLRQQGRTRLRDAEKALAWAHHDAATLPEPVRARGRQHPAWPDRPAGSLTDADLTDTHRDLSAELRQVERQLSAARRRVREATTSDQRGAAAQYRAGVEATARQLYARRRELDQERALRDVMRPDDRAREAAQRADISTPDTADRLSEARAATGEGIDIAAARVERTRTIVERIDTEVRQRSQVPTAERRVEAGAVRPDDHDVPEWIADRRHHRVPDDSRWAEHLDERRKHLADRLADMAREVAAQQPQWAIDTLGPRPEDARRAAAWDHAAGRAAAYREMFEVQPDDHRILGKEPRPDGRPRREAYEEVRASIEPVTAERARANRAAAAANARAELQRKLRQAADRKPIDPTTPRTPTREHDRQQTQQTSAPDRARTEEQRQRQIDEQRRQDEQRRLEEQRRVEAQRRLDEQRRIEQERGRRGPQAGPRL